MSRLIYNRKIIKLLSKAVEDNPDLRLFQIFQLLNLTQSQVDSKGLITGLRDEFYTESKDLYERIPGVTSDSSENNHYKQLLTAMESLMPPGSSKDFLRDSIANFPPVKPNCK